MKHALIRALIATTALPLVFPMCWCRRPSRALQHSAWSRLRPVDRRPGIAVSRLDEGVEHHQDVGVEIDRLLAPLLPADARGPSESAPSAGSLPPATGVLRLMPVTRGTAGSGRIIAELTEQIG